MKPFFIYKCLLQYVQVRNAAFFSLGQFSEFLQPEISKYANEILPILFEFLHNLCVEIRVS